MSIASHIQRCIWLGISEEIKSLGKFNVSKLSHHMVVESYKDNDTVYMKNSVETKIILIESGVLYLGEVHYLFMIISKLFIITNKIE